MSNDTTIRFLVFGIELMLAFGLIGWMRSSYRGVREPWSFVILLLGCGALAALLSAIVQLKYSFDIPALTQSDPVLIQKYGITLRMTNYFAAASIEEMGKYMIGVFTLISTRHAHKLSDTIVYLIIIGLGFALIEDAIYLLDPIASPLLRLMSFYLHSGTSAVIGYSLGRYKFGLAKSRELLIAVIIAIALHFGYNLTTDLYGNSALWLAAAFTLFITLQIFVLFRRTLVEEYGLELRAQRLKYTMLVTGSKGV